MKFYRIDISGLGGEVVFGKATLQQYNFWNDPELLMDAGFEDDDEALQYYINDKEEWEETIPKTARFDYEWYEMDEYGHYNGPTLDSAYIEVAEVEHADWGAAVIEDVYEGRVDKLVEQNIEALELDELDLDVVLEDKPPFIFYAMSVEKGGFISATVALEDEFDIKKLKFYATRLPTEDEIISHIEYDNVELSNEGGDTIGKSMNVEVWEW